MLNKQGMPSLPVPLLLPCALWCMLAQNSFFREPSVSEILSTEIFPLTPSTIFLITSSGRVGARHGCRDGFHCIYSEKRTGK